MSKKLAYGDLFRQECTVCLLAYGSPGGRRCKETLLRKASGPTAHVAGAGIQSESCGPPTPPGEFFDSLNGSAFADPFFIAEYNKIRLFLQPAMYVV